MKYVVLIVVLFCNNVKASGPLVFFGANFSPSGLVVTEESSGSGDVDSFDSKPFDFKAGLKWDKWFVYTNAKFTNIDTGDDEIWSRDVIGGFDTTLVDSVRGDFEISEFYAFLGRKFDSGFSLQFGPFGAEYSGESSIRDYTRRDSLLARRDTVYTNLGIGIGIGYSFFLSNTIGISAGYTLGYAKARYEITQTHEETVFSAEDGRVSTLTEKVETVFGRSIQRNFEVSLLVVANKNLVWNFGVRRRVVESDLTPIDVGRTEKIDYVSISTFEILFGFVSYF